MTQWFEDIELEKIHALGSHTFTAEEIISFATRYDPQYFHLNAEAAKLSPFGGLVASGWHTAAMGHRKLVDKLYEESERLKSIGEEPGVSGPSPGINEMMFKAPVRPGDTVRYEFRVVSKRPSNSLPGWGLLINIMEAFNQSGELVYRGEWAGFSKLRDFKPSLGLKLAMWAAGVPGLKKLVRK